MHNKAKPWIGNGLNGKYSTKSKKKQDQKVGAYLSSCWGNSEPMCISMCFYCDLLFYQQPKIQAIKFWPHLIVCIFYCVPKVSFILLSRCFWLLNRSSSQAEWRLLGRRHRPTFVMRFSYSIWIVAAPLKIALLNMPSVVNNLQCSHPKLSQPKCSLEQNFT